MFSHFDTIPACDGRTDGRTDRRPSITCFSIADARKNQRESFQYFNRKNAAFYTQNMPNSISTGAPQTLLGCSESIPLVGFMTADSRHSTFGYGKEAIED